jgi:hypothetical protein
MHKLKAHGIGHPSGYEEANLEAKKFTCDCYDNMFPYTLRKYTKASINILQDTCSFNNPPELFDDLLVETVQLTLH